METSANHYPHPECRYQFEMPVTVCLRQCVFDGGENAVSLPASVDRRCEGV
jgi:hypothetical protein